MGANQIFNTEAQGARGTEGFYEFLPYVHLSLRASVLKQMTERMTERRWGKWIT